MLCSKILILKPCYSCAVAADINKDGKQDLVIAGHWMDIEVWMNKNDHFEKDTSVYIIAKGFI
jgi:hypothetical protein